MEKTTQKLSVVPQIISKPTQASDKTHPVSQVYFSQMVRIPGYPGAATIIRTGGEDAGLGTNQHRVKSLHLIGNRLLVDSVFWMPLESGVITGWVY